MHKTPLPEGGVLRFRAGHWPPSKSWPMVFHRAYREAPPVGIPLFQGRSMAVALTECLLLCGLTGD
jgi:hypothetical protein